jgi:sulfite reductase alpha subunit-like flavoprotein
MDLSARPSRAALAHFASLLDGAKPAATTAALREVTANPRRHPQWLGHLRWADVWATWPGLSGRVTAARFFELCPVVTPRSYSVSSSSLATQSEVALTVGQHTWALPHGPTRKVCDAR